MMMPEFEGKEDRLKAFVTGGTGFIGSSIVRELLKAGYEVRALVRQGADTRNLDGLEIERVQGDITDIDSLHRAMVGCERVFHAAALYSFWVREPGLIDPIPKRSSAGTRRASTVPNRSHSATRARAFLW
jgi:uncharacterized protein YbjT (DUF2867 family)